MCLCVHIHTQGLSRKYPAMYYEKQRHLLKKIKETLDIGQWCLSPLPSRHLGTSHSSPNCHQLSCFIFLNLINSLKSLPFQGDFSFGKSHKSQGAKLGLYGGQVTWVIWCFTKKHCMGCDAWAGVLLWWSCQSLAAHSCTLVNHLNSFCRGVFKLHANFMQIFCSTCSVIFQWDGHTVHMLMPWCLPPPLTSTMRSSLFTYVHFSPLSLAAMLHQCHTNRCHYINNSWTFYRQSFYINSLLCQIFIGYVLCIRQYGRDWYTLIE